MMTTRLLPSRPDPNDLLSHEPDKEGEEKGDLISSIYSGRVFLLLLSFSLLLNTQMPPANIILLQKLLFKTFNLSDSEQHSSTLVPISLDGPYAEFMSSATSPAIVLLLLLIGLVLLLCVNLRDLLVRMMCINKNITRGKPEGNAITLII